MILFGPGVLLLESFLIIFHRSFEACSLGYYEFRMLVMRAAFCLISSCMGEQALYAL